MINRNTSLNYNTKNRAFQEEMPFLLKPAGKDYLWGGQRLRADFGKESVLNPLAETWECSTHPDGPSLVESGAFAGMTLKEVLKEHPEYLGTHPLCNYTKEQLAAGELPVLIKFIDAKKDLSVQVHPDDEYARTHENGSRGKTEMWYVLDAAKDSSLVYGFSQDMEREQLKKSMEDGTIGKYLQKIPVHKNDTFYIEAGTVHAIGAGCLMAEIQENSNLTYRMYDYDRQDKYGKKRPLHIEKALEVVKLDKSTPPGQPQRVLNYHRGCATELLCRCRYFQVERMLFNTEQCRQLLEYHTDSTSFQVLLCIDGCGVMLKDGAGELQFFKGDCIFVPAGMDGIRIHGKGKMLKVVC